MRGIAIVFALLLALAAAAPAQAQETGLPLWLVGTWCGELGGPGNGKDAPPELCDNWVAGDDGTLQNRIVAQEGTTARGGESSGAISVEDGHLMLRGGYGGKITVQYREVSRGPTEATFENLLGGPMQRMTLRREGDALIEELWFAGRSAPQRTVYHLKD